MAPILIVLVAGLVAGALGMTAAAVRAKQLDKAAVVDVAWGAGFVLIALAAAVVGTVLDEGTGWRRWLVAAMVAAWGLRLAWHIRGRAVGEHGGKEDPRYAEMLGGPPSEIGMGVLVRRVFLVQGWSSGSSPCRSWSARCSPSTGGRSSWQGWSSGPRDCSSRQSATASSRRTSNSRRRPGPRSWTGGCGATPGIPTTSGTPASGGASGWSPGSARAGWPDWRPCSARPP